MKQVAPRFKKDQKVVMINCDEGKTKMDKNKKKQPKKIWVCTEDSFQRINRLERDERFQVVQLKGFNGRFWCKYLKFAK